MKKLLFAVAAAATLGLAVPASAQVFVGADSGGVGVQLGPLGVGVGPRFSDDRYRYRYRHRRRYDADARYGDNCRLIRTRVVRANGRVVHRTRQVCR